MRQVAKITIAREDYSDRLKVGFLFFPKTINGETRWLEYANWMQHFTYHYQNGFSWDDIAWVVWTPKK